MFGDYWHNRPHQKKKDWFRFKVFKRNGYKTLVVWEHELNDIKSLIKKIKNFNDK
jgi:very-short-patch-repair endonuclease